MRIDDEDEYLYTNDQFITECCGAPVLGEIIDDVGMCSRCHEWSGVKQDPENETE